ncbi:MAG: hypothetical protein U0Q18_04425 [Bryobacteraceae bacterium]
MKQVTMALLCSVLLSGAVVVQLGAAELLVFGVSPPGISVVDTSRWTVTHRVALPAVPAAVAIHPGEPVFYVLVNGATGADGSLPKGPSEIVAFDAASRRILRRIEAGWGASRMTFTKDSRWLACFRDRSPWRDFERPPSLAVGIIGLSKGAMLGRKPSAITIIDTRTHDLAWRKDLDEDHGNVLFSPAARRFIVPGDLKQLKLMDLPGSVQPVALPASRSGKRQVALSPDGLWAYVIENGHDSPEKAERLNGRVFAIEASGGRMASMIETEPDKLDFVESADPAGVAVANSSGAVRQFRGPELVWRIETGRDLRFARRLPRESGLLIAGDRRVRFVPDRAIVPAWTLDWHDQLHGAPCVDLVRVADSSLIAVPVMRTNDGLDLDRVVLLDIDARRVTGSVPVGRRSRMAAKAFGLALAAAASSSSTWANAVPGPNSFNLNGFAVDVARGLQPAFRLLLPHNPLLNIRPDGRFGYAMSRFGGDVTVFETSTGSILAHIPVGKESRGLLPPSDGSLLCAWAGSELTWIDMNANSVKLRQKACDRRFARVQVDAEQRWIAAFSDRCAGFYDPRTGARLGHLENMGKPRLMLPVQLTRASVN